jgi:hypothetical protein
MEDWLDISAMIKHMLNGVLHIRSNVKNFVDRCRIFQYAKGKQ